MLDGWESTFDDYEPARINLRSSLEPRCSRCLVRPPAKGRSGYCSECGREYARIARERSRLHRATIDIAFELRLQLDRWLGGVEEQSRGVGLAMEFDLPNADAVARAGAQEHGAAGPARTRRTHLSICPRCMERPRRVAANGRVQPTCVPCRREKEAQLFQSPVERARYLVRKRTRYLVRKGRITKTPCARCGDTRVHAHHVDYSKPEQVEWLCSRHHQAAHAAKPNTGDALTYRRLNGGPECSRCRTQRRVRGAHCEACHKEMQRRRALPSLGAAGGTRANRRPGRRDGLCPRCEDRPRESGGYCVPCRREYQGERRVRVKRALAERGA